MKSSPKLKILAASALLFAGMGWLAHRTIRQQQELRAIRHRLAEPAPLPGFASQTGGAPPHRRPSAGLLRARAEVAELLQQVAERAGPGMAADASRNESIDSRSELDRLMKGRRPSEFPDFKAAEGLKSQGFDTPDHALESFWWHFAGPDRMGNDSARLWWDPPKTNVPNGYHIVVDLGMGVGGLTGYRVARREEISPDEVLFHLQREEGRSVVEEQARFIRDGDRWVRKPSVKLVPDQP